MCVESKVLHENRMEPGSTKCTFEVRVRFMQNSTWQGEIHWLEANQMQNFRSVLEMIKLMDEALTDETEGRKPVRWED